MRGTAKDPNADKRRARFKNKVGERYGRLLVIDLVERKPEGASRWRCLCDCGEETVVMGTKLVSGNTQSCGCLGRSKLQAGGANKLPFGEASFRTLFGQYERSAKYRGLEFKLTKEQFRDLTSSPCAYCGTTPENKYRGGPKINGFYKFNGIDRAHNHIGYLPENCVPCCTTCNRAKATMGLERWHAWLARLAIFHIGAITDREGNPIYVRRAVANQDMREDPAA